MSDGQAHIQPGDRIKISSGKHLQNPHDPKSSDKMVVEWVEVQEDGTRLIWVRRP